MDKPIEFQIIEEIQQNDLEIADEKVLDQRIVDAELQLRSIRDQENRLKDQYEKIQEKLENASKKNDLMMDDFTKTDNDPVNPSGTGSFFVQLRHLEAEIERWENTKERLESLTHSLEGDISSASAQRNRLMKKTESLREQCQNAKINQLAKQNELKSLNDKLLMTTTELDDLKRDVEEIKKKIQDRAQEAQELSPEELALLIAQKNFLQKEVMEKRKFLDSLINEENSTNTRINNLKIRNPRKNKNTYLISNWFHDRINLISKIKNLRKEMKNLQTRERGTIRSVERNQQQIESINFNNDEIKLALIAEKNLYKFEKSQFMLDAMEIEQRYTQKLQTRSGKLDKTQTVIDEFKDSTESVMRLNEECVTDDTRKSLLLEELRELRKQFF
ncbi:hypothetical protein M9Y10_043900 [Tritrichomonas musculus]|uniref:Uncharacterized protein n=1 Tax=Tritrichomonas musculus TaxID=1915356 RepID=A0ABR2K3W9_9EUKA